MDRLSPLSTDSGFESLSPSSPDTMKPDETCSRNEVCSAFSTSGVVSAALPSSVMEVLSVNDNVKIANCHSHVESACLEVMETCAMTPSTSYSREPSEVLDTAPTSSAASTCNLSLSDHSSTIVENSGHKLVVNSTVEGDDEYDEVMRYYCLWNGCPQQHDHADQLYDHVVKDHIGSLRHIQPSTSDDGDLEEEGSLSCKWRDCSMSLRRGDRIKKISWLEEHYRTRHARNAQPFICVIEGCTQRFSTTRRLEEHVRSGHIKEPKPGSHPTLHCPYYDNLLLERVRFLREHDFDVAFIPHSVTNVVGAQRRKRQYTYAYDIVPRSKAPKKALVTTDKSVAFNVDEESRITLTDLFPPVSLPDISVEDGIIEIRPSKVEVNI
uniref:C2H2-type domain-containing protein n=1 Tax=Heterorhabditis bacteriophora TaxID=37862 RepID=A0A1I7XPM4_HETBA